MATQAEINRHAKLIIETHNGQMFYNLTEARKILGFGASSIARKLHEAGVTIQTKGSDKIVSAYGIAECGLHDRKAAIDNAAWRGKANDKSIAL
ncbi:MAG: hypothetical protein FWG61_00465 [Firmicutes bacterium]|nr:hypothetical protein [Bacillota bacterium]